MWALHGKASTKRRHLAGGSIGAAEKAVIICFSTILAMSLIGGSLGLRVNLSASIDGTLFLTKRSKASIEVGDLVVFCLPARIGEYPQMLKASLRVCADDQAGVHLLKRVAQINPDGTLWVLGETRNSLDSRVFGSIPSASVVSTVDRLW